MRRRSLVIALGALALTSTAAGLPARVPSTSGFASVRPVGLAQDLFELIARYSVDIAIEPTGDLLITEAIGYNFGVQERHGIFRDVPVRLRYDDTYDRVFPMDVLSVTASPGTPSEYVLEDVDGQTRIRIGDPDATITGRHDYTIVYRIEAALNGFEEHDELYWNAVGTGWDVLIRDVTVRVTAPAPATRVACFAGPEGSSLACDGAALVGGDARFTQALLGPSSGLTVVVAIPKGVVPEPLPILEERWSFDRAFSRTPATVTAGSVLLLLVVAAFGRLAWVTGRDRRAAGSFVDAAFAGPGLPGTPGQEQPVALFERGGSPVEYAPPDGIRAGQMGTLMDETANPLDVTATIVDLAVRGYLRIEEIPKQGWFGKKDWKLVMLRDGTDLLPYERLLFDGLFEEPSSDFPPDPGPVVRLSELKKKFVARLTKVQEALYVDAVGQRWFPARPDRVRALWIGVGIGLVVVAIGVVVVVARFTHFGLVPIPLVVGGLLVLAGANSMPRRTAVGTGLVRRVAGFRRYIETAETEPAQFAERANLFYQYLPYAVVFGCTDKWARAFAGLGDLPHGSWYVGPHPFTVLAFSEAIDGFSVTSTGTIASTPGGSGGSGFGGGGSSGGGGGGGGGGSW